MESKNGINQIIDTYSNSWKLFIKPKKYKYDEDELPCFLNCNTDNIFKKFSFKLTNKFCNKIQCHLYYITTIEEINNNNIIKNNCLIYLHSQNGNSIQGKFLINYCIDNNLSLCLIDFQGCGNSEGKEISLGWNEKDDLELLVNYLRINNYVKKIYLYGRSMGAVTAILYLERNCFNIEKCILDSPFKNLRKTSERMAKEIINLPNFIIKFLWNLISNKIKKKIGINIFELNPKNYIPFINIPVFLIGSKNDNLITLKEINKLFNNFPKPNNNILKIINNKHNEVRDFELIDEIFTFIKFNNDRKPKKRSSNFEFLQNKNIKSPSIKKEQGNLLLFKFNKNINKRKSNKILNTELILSDRKIFSNKNKKKLNKKLNKNPIKYLYQSKCRLNKNIRDTQRFNSHISHNWNSNKKSILNFNFYINKK